MGLFWPWAAVWFRRRGVLLTWGMIGISRPDGHRPRRTGTAAADYGLALGSDSAAAEGGQEIYRVHAWDLRSFALKRPPTAAIQIMDTPLCCVMLTTCRADVGRRGLSCLVVHRGEDLYFALQSRGIDADLVPELQAHFRSAPDFGQINVVAQYKITTCPFCGTDLDRWIVQHAELAFGLAQEHRAFVLEI